MSDKRTERFEQPAEYIEIVERASQRVPIEGLARARERIAAGEDRDKVITDLAIEMVEADEQFLRSAEFNEDQPRDERGRWTGGGRESLSPQDLETVDSWAWPDSLGNNTGMGYQEMRNPQTDEGKRMSELLNRLPIHEGTVYRGLALESMADVEKLVSSKGYELNLHSSSSGDLHTAVMFMDGESYSNRHPVVLEVEGRSRDINHLLPEDLQGTNEKVLVAGTRYRFAGLRRERFESFAGDDREYLHIKLKEVR